MSNAKYYLDNVYMVSVKRRKFDWTLPHQSIIDKDSVRGTAFTLRYKNKIVLATCFHVLKDAFHITITSPVIGSLEHVCRIVWVCPALDLAIIEIKDKEMNKKLCRTGLTPCVFPGIKKKNIIGPSIGDTVQTVGFPLGQSNLKITKGILSGQQLGLYQTDAPINGGNSGGPLIWKDKVLGINVSGYVFAQNIAYAIPITRLLHLIDYHHKHPFGIIRFPRIWGIAVSPPVKLLMQQTEKDLKTKWMGVQISDIFPHHMFHGTSIKKGDILLKINGIPLSHIGEMDLTWMDQNMNFFNFFHHIHLGQKLRIDYQTAQSKKTEFINVVPESERLFYREWHTEHEDIPYLYIYGIVMVPFNETMMHQRTMYLKYHENIKESVENNILYETKDVDDSDLLRRTEPACWSEGCIIVSNVLKGGRMNDLKLIKIGDIITSINQHPVSSIEQARRYIMQSLKNKNSICIGIHNKLPLSISLDALEKEERHLAAIYKYESTIIKKKI